MGILPKQPDPRSTFPPLWAPIPKLFLSWIVSNQLQPCKLEGRNTVCTFVCRKESMRSERRHFEDWMKTFFETSVNEHQTRKCTWQRTLDLWSHGLWNWPERRLLIREIWAFRIKNSSFNFSHDCDSLVRMTCEMKRLVLYSGSPNLKATHLHENRVVRQYGHVCRTGNKWHHSYFVEQDLSFPVLCHRPGSVKSPVLHSSNTNNTSQSYLHLENSVLTFAFQMGFFCVSNKHVTWLSISPITRGHFGMPDSIGLQVDVVDATEFGWIPQQAGIAPGLITVN